MPQIPYQCPAQHLSQQFDYDHDTNTFTAWASELGSRMFGQLFEDACDVGLTIVSGRTGSISSFYISEEQRDDDNDISAWYLKPTNETVKRFPLLKDATVVVFND